jgi:predicted ATPase
MIRRVKIRGYKSLKDIEVEFQPLTVIIWPNAAGKSNLFDALGLLSRLATFPTLGEAFKEHRGAPVEAFFYGSGGLTWLLTQEAATFTIEVDVELTPEVVTAAERRIQAATTTTTTLAWQSPEVVATVERRIQERQSGEAEPALRRISETRLRYTLTVEMAMGSGRLGVKAERLVALNQDGAEKASTMPFIQPTGNRLYLQVEGQGRSFEYTVDQDHTLVSTSLYPPYHPHAMAFKEELSRWHFYYLDPETMRTESSLKEIDTLGPFGADLAAFYHTLRTRSPQQFQALNRALCLLLPEVQELSVERTPEGLLRLLVLEDTVPYSARVISEGTLRILGLLAITNPLAPTTVIGYEEPENGVHPRRLQLIAELLQTAATEGKQILVNTHSPKLPEYLEPSSLVVCSKENGATTFVPLRDLGPLFRAGQIEQALKETPLMERVLRGDFGG